MLKRESLARQFAVLAGDDICQRGKPRDDIVGEREAPEAASDPAAEASNGHVGRSKAGCRWRVEENALVEGADDVEVGERVSADGGDCDVSGPLAPGRLLEDIAG